MAKRMTETDLWKKQRWFRKLDPLDKLVFCYLKDQCSHAGIWKIDCSDLMEDLGLDCFDLQKFVASINSDFDILSGCKINRERLRIVKEKYLWITGFIQFQYENKAKHIKVEYAAARSALIELHGFNLLDEAVKRGFITLPHPYEGLESLIVKVKVRVKEEEGDDETFQKPKKQNNGNRTNGQRRGVHSSGQELYAQKYAR